MRQSHRCQQRAVGEAIVEVVVVLIAKVGGELQLLANNILAKEGHPSVAEIVRAIVWQLVPRGEMVDTQTIGLLLVAGRTPIEVGHRSPVIAHTYTQVIVV